MNLSEMKIHYVIIYAVSMFLIATDSQTIKYANRCRNFTVESESGALKMINLTIFQDKMDHKFAGSCNITRDVHVKSITVVLHRCTFEKFACENFQQWKFTENLKSIIYMKNQLWTPFFENFTPKFNLPYVKKGIYTTRDANIDAKAALTFYPDAAKYLWRIDLIVVDEKDRKVAVFKFETEFFSYVERDRKKERERPKP